MGGREMTNNLMCGLVSTAFNILYSVWFTEDTKKECLDPKELHSRVKTKCVFLFRVGVGDNDMRSIFYLKKYHHSLIPFH